MLAVRRLVLLALLVTGTALAEDDVPSALDGLISSDEPGRRITRFGTEKPTSTGAWFVWPVSSASHYVGPPREKTYSSNFLGMAVGRRWYAIGGKVRYFVEGAVAGEFPLGPRTHGRMLRTYVLAGPRARYLSVLVGPALVHNELHLDRAADLEAALFVGSRVLVLTDLGLITLYAGIEPLWRLHGDRPSATYADLFLPGFGDEFSYLGGISVGLGRHWRVLAGDRIWLSSIGVYQQPTIGVSIQ